MVSKSAKKLATSQRSKWLEILAQSAANSETGNYRVLLDTNIWLSGILFGGKPEKVVRFCKQHHRIIISEYLIDELLDYLKTTKAPYKWRNALEKLLKRLCVLVEPPNLPSVSRDPKDDPVIAAAVTGGCQFLVTGDEDLLSLKSHQGVNIISSSDFLELPQVKKHFKK